MLVAQGGGPKGAPSRGIVNFHIDHVEHFHVGVDADRVEELIRGIMTNQQNFEQGLRDLETAVADNTAAGRRYEERVLSRLSDLQNEINQLKEAGVSDATISRLTSIRQGLSDETQHFDAQLSAVEVAADRSNPDTGGGIGSTEMVDPVAVPEPALVNTEGRESSYPSNTGRPATDPALNAGENVTAERPAGSTDPLAVPQPETGGVAAAPTSEGEASTPSGEGAEGIAGVERAEGENTETGTTTPSV